MSISNSATGLRPGVVTSTTRPTTPYTGQIIYETDTGYLRVWDGSAWDYLSQSQDTTTNLPISDIGKAWTSFTPTVSSQSGSITSYSVNGRYTQINKLCLFRFQIGIANRGSASGAMYVTVPVNAQAGYGSGTSAAVGAWSEWTVIGMTGTVNFLNSVTTLALLRHDWTTPFAGNGTFSGQVIYETV